PWVAGYDLLNETNWDLPGNRMLADLYKELTDTIRSIDQNHILFIEGNWFANDFTGLTPPWDDNMVYAPHKYWSINDQASIQWVLDLRERYDIPLYLGESGENSNVWFRDAIRLLEENNIGWAWWPMKKVESISGPLSIVKSEEYETLLNYWKGQGVKPTREFATSALMQFAEDTRIENCVFQKDVIDAMFRQVYSDEAIPFNTQIIPGIVYATDFDMGVIGSAYSDNEVANYHVSTGTYTAWNNGWIYRNDGVDIEVCSDDVNSNGYNVGWIDQDEWMQYDVEVELDGVYDVKVRLAAGVSGGRFHFKSGSSDLIDPVTVNSSGGWQNWTTVTVPNVVLHSTDKKIIFYADQEGFNVSSFDFVYQGSSTTVSTTFISAITLDENTIQLNFNKAIDGPLPQNLNGFKLTVNGKEIEGISTTQDEINGRILYINVTDPLLFDDVLKVSYQGDNIKSTDGTVLLSFLNELVKNTLTTHYSIPGKIEAEDYFLQSGIQLENTTDAGGGKNIGYLDVNDYLEYKVNIKQAGSYTISFRTASQSARGGLKLSLIDRDGEKSSIGSFRFDATGGWQNWTTHTFEADLPEGRYTLLMEITHTPFNLNWMDFLLNDEPETSDSTYLKVFPVPSNGIVNIEGQFRIPHNLTAKVYNNIGNLVLSERYGIQSTVREVININHFPSGLYYLRLELEDGTTYLYRLIKVDQ
ncbi:MAG: carbohydrate-binding protein, partial [Saprospiraceae bacterium]|nr:carbohydrate-binding protein [Saprospiraceae bacterium]